ncbi:unnamed protein product [Commensalibacter communis]|nr:unnamed protein product [Commensalibacter communis]
MTLLELKKPRYRFHKKKLTGEYYQCLLAPNDDKIIPRNQAIMTIF